MRSTSLSRLFATIALALLMGVPPISAADKATGAAHRVSSDGATRLEKSEQAAVHRDAPQPVADEELAQLESRAEQPGEDVRGGALSNEHLTYIVIAIAAAVVVLVLK